MHKFKIGDRVVCSFGKNPPTGWDDAYRQFSIVRRVATIKQLLDTSSYYLDGIDAWWWERELELAEPANTKLTFIIKRR